jgi:hypothetical protein
MLRSNSSPHVVVEPGTTSRRAGLELDFAGGIGHHLGHIPDPISTSFTTVERGRVRTKDDDLG